MLDAIIGFFMFVIVMVVFFAAVVVAVLIKSNSGYQSYDNSYDDDDDDEDSYDTEYIVEASNNTNLGYMKVGGSGSESAAIRWAESYIKNRSNANPRWRVRVVEVVNGKRRGTVWSS